MLEGSWEYMHRACWRVCCKYIINNTPLTRLQAPMLQGLVKNPRVPWMITLNVWYSKYTLCFTNALLFNGSTVPPIVDIWLWPTFMRQSAPRQHKAFQGHTVRAHPALGSWAFRRLSKTVSLRFQAHLQCPAPGFGASPARQIASAAGAAAAAAVVSESQTNSTISISKFVKLSISAWELDRAPGAKPSPHPPKYPTSQSSGQFPNESSHGNTSVVGSCRVNPACHWRQIYQPCLLNNWLAVYSYHH